MRLLAFLLTLSSLGLADQMSGNPATVSGLKEYQERALGNTFKGAQKGQVFDPGALPMEKILSAAAIGERGCAIPLLEARGDRHVDERMKRAAGPNIDRMPRVRHLPVCPAEK